MAGGNVIVTIVGNASQLSAALSGAAGDMDTFAGKANAVGTKMQSVGKGLTLGLTVPIVGLGAVAFRAASDWESAWAGVTKTVDGTLLQMIALKKGIMDMAKELPASTVEIAAVAEAAGALGIQTDAVLDFTRVMIDLGETTNLTADVAAESLAQLANIVQMSADDYDNLGSAIVDLGNKGASTEADIVAMAQRIAGAGKQVGLTTPQILGVASALANVGIEAEAGGTAISRTFIEMASAAEIGGDAIAGFAAVAGVSADEFAEKFKTDAAGAMQDFVAGLQRIDQEGGSVLLTLDELGIVEIRQRDAILRLVGAGNNLADSIAISNQAWVENNALQDEAAKRYGTTAAEMEIMKNKINASLVVLGEALIPVIEKVAGWLTTLAEKWQGLSPGWQDFIIKATALAAALGPLVFIIGSVVKLVGLIGAGFALATTPIAGFSGALATAVIGAGAFYLAFEGTTWLLEQLFGKTRDLGAELEELKNMAMELSTVADDQLTTSFQNIMLKFKETHEEAAGMTITLGAFDEVVQTNIGTAARLAEQYKGNTVLYDAMQRMIQKESEAQQQVAIDREIAAMKARGEAVDVAALTQYLKDLGGQRPQPEVDVQTEQALADIANVQHFLDSLRNKEVYVNVITNYTEVSGDKTPFGAFS